MAYDYDLIHVAVDDGVAIAIDRRASDERDDHPAVPPARAASALRSRSTTVCEWSCSAARTPTSSSPTSTSKRSCSSRPRVSRSARAPRTRSTRCASTVRTMPKATIAEIDGRVGGGGSEFASSCDMRFGAIGRTVVNQMEVPLGILPGGTGTQRLPRLVGRGRAMEIVLGGVDIDAVTAERWGYLNRALEPTELRPFVDALATRIAGFPAGAIALAKQSVLNAERLPLAEGLAEESFLFQQTLARPGSTGGDETVPRARRSDPRRRAAGGRRRHRALAEL